jgi:uncharacterized protein (TIRG00374 family)
MSEGASWLSLLRGKGRALLIALVISALAMWLALLNVSMDGLGRALAQADLLCLLGVAALFMAQQLVRTWRQAEILRAHHPEHRFLESFGVLCIGFFFINSLPLRIGEVVRPLMLKDREQIPLGHGFAMVFSERVIDLAAMLVMIGVVAWVLPVPSHELSLVGLGLDQSVDWVTLGRWAILAAIPLVLLAGGTVIFAGRPLLSRLSRLAQGRGPRVQALMSRILVFSDEFIPAVEALREPRRMARIVIASVITWGLTGCMYPLLAQGFGIQDSIGYGEGIAILGFTMMGMTLPSFFGFAGTYEAAVVLALSLFGLSGAAQLGGSSLDDLAAAYALTMHWWVYGVQAVSAVAFLVIWKVDLGALVTGIRGLGQSDD